MSENSGPIMGVYRILNIRTGEAYVGSSVNIELRWKSWRANLAMNRYVYATNTRLLLDWHAHGAGAFQFDILEQVPRKEDLAHRETWWIEQHGWLVYNVHRTVNTHPAMTTDKRLAWRERRRIPQSALDAFLKEGRPEEAAETSEEITAPGLTLAW